MKQKSILRFVAILMTAMLCFTACSNENAENNIADAKPVIYLYPEQKTDVTVTLDYDGELWVTYPRYEDGWQVTAYPDGTLINQADQAEYSYLFWDGMTDTQYDFTTGFVVKGEDTEAFLKDKLQYMGLTAKEYNEFIVYWLPKMVGNPYNLVSFQQRRILSMLC